MKFARFAWAAVLCAGTLMSLSDVAIAQSAGIIDNRGVLFRYGICISKDRKYLYIVPAEQMRTPGSQRLIPTLADCTSMHPDLREAIGNACSSVTMDRQGTRWPQTWANRIPEFGVPFSCRR